MPGPYSARPLCNKTEPHVPRKDFMTHVASECKKQKHHPEWTNVYNHTRIRWTTHKPEGLSRRDTSMARFCDEAGEQFEEVGGVQDLVADAKECCGGGGGGVKKA